MTNKKPTDAVREFAERYERRIAELEEQIAEDSYKQAAEYWQRMYEETFAERTCKNVGYYIDGTRFKCSECGYNGWTKWAKDGEDRVPNYCPNCGAKIIGGNE